MMTRENDALIRRWFEEVWNQGRAEAIDELLAEDAIVHGLTDDSENPLRGPAAFKEFHTRFREAFPDIVVTVEDTIEEVDKVTARCTVRGKHTGDSLGFAATHAPVVMTGISITRSKDGKILEAWNNFDFMAMYQQLDVIQL
jgi:steroid delta-isomerase-like uncharacterized protein